MSWKIKKLSDICEIKLGKTPSRSDKSYWDDDKVTSNKWVSIADLTKLKSRHISDSKEYISNKGASLFKPVKSGTLLMSFKLSIGKLAYAGCDLYTNEAIVALPVKNTNEIDVQFLYYYLQFYDWDKETENDVKLKGKTLNKAKLAEIRVPLPNLDTQKKIVSKLDAIFVEVENATKANESIAKNAEALFQNYLDEIFDYKTDDWYTYTFDEIVLDKQVGLVKNSKEQVENGKYPYFKMNNITNDNRCDLTSLARVNATAEEVEKYRLVKNDFLFNTRNSVELVGKACVFQGDMRDGILYNNNIMRVRFKENINPEFVLLALSNKTVKENLEKVKTGATNVAAIYYKDLKGLNIPIPNLDSQIAIIQKLDEINSYANTVYSQSNNKISNLRALKKSILQQAFNGELVKE